MTRRERQLAREAAQRALVRDQLALKRSREAEPPASNSFYWRPKRDHAQEDAPWLNDGWSRR
jgi:hypothetical protein